MRLLIEAVILACFGLVAWIMVHGLLDPTWTRYEVLLALGLVLWLAGRFYILRRRDRLHRLPES